MEIFAILFNFCLSHIKNWSIQINKMKDRILINNKKNIVSTDLPNVNGQYYV